MIFGSLFARFRLWSQHAVPAEPFWGAQYIVATLCALLVLAGSSSHAEEIRVGDTLAINVAQWDATSGELQDWRGWQVDYRVDSEGSIVLPFVGELVAARNSTGVLSDEIATGLINVLSPSSLLGVTVEIVERRPVLIHGIVRDAGAVAYRNGMTVREAIALAGGVSLLGQTGSSSELRAAITTSAQIVQTRLREDELAARVARLTAETTDADEIAQLDFSQPERGEEFLDRERRMFDLDRETRSRALALIESRLHLLETEIASLNQRATALSTQQEFAAKQLDAVMQLSSQGLSANSRVLEAQQTFSTIETQLLDVGGALLAARQDIARAEADRLEIVQGRASQAIAQLQSSLSELDELRIRRGMQERLIALTGALDQSLNTATVTVLRLGETEPMAVTLSDTLEPGDIVEVTAPASP